MRQAFAGLKTGVSSFYNRFGNLPFIGILLLIAVYFWANGRAWFPDWDSSYGQLVEIYIVMLLIFLVLSARQQWISQQLRMPLWMAGRAFTIAFIATWGILECFILTGWLQVPQSFPIELFWQTVLVQVCVVATAEEVMFRGVILSSLEFYFKSTPIAIVGSSAIFSIWHLWAYQIILYDLNWSSFNWLALIVAFFMANILGLIAKNKQWGLPACIGIHSCYNLLVIGAIAIF